MPNACVAFCGLAHQCPGRVELSSIANIVASPSEQIRAAFLASLPEDLRAAYDQFRGLDGELSRLVADASARVPELGVDVFCAALASRISDNAPPEETLARARAGDLALAVACARGDPQALARFESEMFPQIDGAAARFPNSGLTRDEVRQAMRDRLFTPQPDGQPRIASYQGRGDLRSWVRMATTRYLVDVVRMHAGRPDQASTDSQLEAATAAVDDPELAFLKQEYRAEFREAFSRALATLDARDRNILRHRYLEKLGVAELASIYGTHRVTMSRTLSRIHAALLESIRREFVNRLGLRSGEVDEVVSLIQSQFELSLSRLLK